MMTVHKLSAGDGYTYYISETASADELRAKGRELGDYYTVSGNPPGVWMGGGIANLGVSGTVTESQMKALFGEGLHPNAETMIAAGASVRDVRLGRGFYQYDGSETAFSRKVRAGYKEFERRHKQAPDVDQRRGIRGRIGAEEFHKAHGRRPADKEELGRFMTASEKPKQQAVTGFDLTFAPPKSVSLLWALGGDKARLAVEKAHENAIAKAIKHLEERGAYTRSGFNGIEQRNVTGGLISGRFRHHDSRTGDPHIHDHVTVSNRVLSEDGKTWLTLDGQHIYKLNVEISEVYQTEMFQELCADMGLATVQRDVGGNRTVTELAGVPEAMIKRGSGRGSTIRQRTCELVREFTETHGYSPNAKQRIKLAQQATLDTRPAKESSKSPQEKMQAWGREYKADRFLTARKFVKAVTKASKIEAAQAMTAENLDVTEIAATVLDVVSSSRAVWGETHIRTEAIRQLGYEFKGQKVPETAVLAITDYALNTGSIALNTTARTHHANELYRADGASALVKANTALYTSAAVLAAEDALLTAAQTDVIPAATAESFELAMRSRSLSGKVQLNAAQEEFARAFACSPKMIVAGIGPAGTGKTTALSLAAEAINHAGGKVIGLATAASAADVLRKDLTKGRNPGPEQITTETLAKFLHAHGTGNPRSLSLKPGDVVIVDEAGMASTRDLAKVLAITEGAGALVRFAGDHNQLTAIGAGGALRLIAHQVGAVELEEIYRFKNPDGSPNTEEAEASLVLRDPETVRGASAFDWYRENGRIVAGGTERMVNDAYAAWQQAVDNGETALMMAADNATVRELNARAQAHRIASGVITGKHSAPLADDAQAHVGDTVLARKIERKLRMNQGKDWVKNGDTYAVLKVHADGALTVRHETHNGTITLPADYVRESVQLGYAATFNRAQGATVDRAFAILKEGVTRAQAYVGATRGRFINMLFGVLDTGVENDIQATSQGLEELLESIGNHADKNLSAHELIDEAHTETHSVARFRAEYINTDTHAQQARVRLLLRSTLGDGAAGKFIDGEAFGALAHRIREAETAGLDAAGIIATAYHQRDFSDADTASAVLEWRIKHLTERSLELLETAGDRPLGNLSDAQLAQLKTIALARHHKAENHLANGLTLTGPDGTPVRVRYPAGVQPWNKRTFGHLNDETLDTRIAKAENDALYFIPSEDGKKARANAWLHKELTAEKTLRASLEAPVFASETAERGVLSVWTDTDEEIVPETRKGTGERTDERGVQDIPEGIARRQKLIADGKDPINETYPAPPLAPAEALTSQEKTPADKAARQPRKPSEPKPRMAKDAAAGSRNRLKQAGTILERITTEEKLRTILPDPELVAEAATIKATLEKAVPEWIAPTHALAYGLATGTIAETWTAELLTARDQITAELGWAGAILAYEQPAWTTALGPVPSDPSRRVEWENTAAQIAVFRETYNVPANDPAPIPAAYLDTKPGEPQTGDLLKDAVTRIHKYTAQTHKAPATTESLAAAAAQARAEQLATGRTDAQNLAAAYLRQRDARVQLSPRQQQTLDAHTAADTIAGTTPPPAEFLTGRPDPQTPGTGPDSGPDGGEPVLVPAHGGPAETRQATTPAHPAQARPADVDYSLATVPAWAMDNPEGMAATADLPVTAEPVLSRAEKATARATEFAQRLQDHAERTNAAAEARQRAEQLLRTETPAAPAEPIHVPALPDAVEPLPQPEPAPAVPETAELEATAEKIPAAHEPAPAPQTVQQEAVELPHVEEPTPQDHLQRQAQLQDAARAELARSQHEHAQEQERKRQELIRERTRAKALRQLPGVANQPREVQDRALERLRAEQERQRKEVTGRTRSTSGPQTPVAEPDQTAQEKAIQQARQQRREQARDEMRRLHGTDPAQANTSHAAPERTQGEPGPGVEDVAAQVRASAQAIETHLGAEAHSSQDNNEAGHAAEEFLRAQQEPAAPIQIEPTPAAEAARPAQEQSFQQKLAALRAKQQQQTSQARPAPAKTDDAAAAALEQLRQAQKDLEKLNARQIEEEQESTRRQPGPEADGPTRRGPIL
jgi:conjugative relaxase-like TrwC/TraI family protein